MGFERYGRVIERLDEDRYRLDRYLGGGGMADVWLAWDERYKRQVAIKVIKPDILDQKTLNRFMKEASQLVQWHHQHILRVYDSKLELLDTSQASVIPYIVMEYAEGSDLKKRLRMGQPYPFEKTIHLFAELCSAVQYAHERGIIHCDLKPANILFRRLPDGSEQTVLSDFGLAVDMNATHISLPGAGTPAYMAPEQGEGPEPASDIFALGVILYQLCTGWLPKENGRLPGELNPELPKRLDRVILKALAKEPTKRYASASLFWQAFSDSVASSKQSSPVSESQKKDIRTTALLSDEAVPAENSIVFRAHNAGKPSHDGGAAVADSQKSPSYSARGSPAANNPVLPPKGNGGTNSSTAIPINRNIRRNRLTAIGLILLSLALISGSIAYAAPGILSHFSSIVPSGLLSSTATVTITPALKTLDNTYVNVITAVTGQPNASQRQVQARILSANPSQSRTVTATGGNQAPYTRATGTLTFYNGSTSSFTVAAGTTFLTSSGVQVVNNVAANIPAANPPNVGTDTVPAHAVNVGASGNIPALALDGTCCASGNFIIVKNLNAFSGGQGPQNYTFLQQSDVDGVANPLEQQLTTSAQANLKGQKHSGEQFINTNNPVSCSPTVTANPPVGSKTTSATVTVQVSCSGEVYDQQTALAMAANLYKSDPTIKPGSGFVLTGNIAANVTQVSIVDNKGTISLQVTVEGIWIYQSAKIVEQEKSWAKQIAGQSKLQAITFLQSQPGIGSVSIQFSSNTLPANPDQITWVVQHVPLSVRSTPTSISRPTPTPTPQNGLDSSN